MFQKWSENWRLALHRCIFGLLGELDYLNLWSYDAWDFFLLQWIFRFAYRSVHLCKVSDATAIQGSFVFLFFTIQKSSGLVGLNNKLLFTCAFIILYRPCVLSRIMD